MFTIKGNIVDIENRDVFFGALKVKNGKIFSIERLKGEGEQYILPGFVDAHIHIESSMLVPSDFARMAVVHGTVATVSDPHEIANVLGIEGVYYMIENGKQVPFKFNFGAPSCVPATSFETAGATIDAEGVATLLRSDDIKYLAEMMNYPGVLFDDEEVLAKLEYAKLNGKPVDGHAPGLRGDDALKYIKKGISTDHECFSYEEALEKIHYGMKVLIREGSAAKNFEALIALLPQFSDMIMLCSDDKHPDDLIEGHINQLVARAIAKGYDLFDVLKVACFNPVEHYNLDVGQLRPGDPADFIVTEDLEQFKVRATYVNGQKVAENGISLIERVEAPVVNNFNTAPKTASNFELKAEGEKIRVIKAIDGELVTESFYAPAKIQNGLAIADVEHDILKMAVINRYDHAPVAVAFIQGFNIKEGALASCVGHDSHNIIAVGTDDLAICEAVNLIIENKGGISAVRGDKKRVLPLPVAGIMTNEDGYLVGQKYSELDAMAKLEMDCTLHAPFMTLSFMALLVIPELKLSDKGLFDGKAFSFAALFG